MLRWFLPWKIMFSKVPGRWDKSEKVKNYDGFGSEEVETRNTVDDSYFLSKSMMSNNVFLNSTFCFYFYIPVLRPFIKRYWDSSKRYHFKGHYKRVKLKYFVLSKGRYSISSTIFTMFMQLSGKLHKKIPVATLLLPLSRSR